MNNTLLNTIRTSYGFSRSVTYLIAIALIGLVTERAIYYTLLESDVVVEENAIEKLYRVAPHKARQLGLPKKTEEIKKSDDNILADAIISVKDTLDVLAYQLYRENGDHGMAIQELEELHDILVKQDKLVMERFAKTDRHIKQYQLAQVIQERQDEMVDNYRENMDRLLENIVKIKVTADKDKRLEVVMEARKHLESKQLKRSQQPFDPNNLPFKSQQPNKDNKPKITEQEFIQAGLYNTPLIQTAALGDFTYGNLVGADNPAYLAETVEVTVTQAIKDKAAELNYDPVQIYHWVLNNVDWLPTWGAMQDADVTLGSLKGNSFDISSLLIALLRASGIPSRYVHGAIDVAEDKYRNWIGGFNDIDAAGNFASSGGIPTTAIIDGGKIKTIRMEHIWVEAAIDYAPSRGAKNIDADAWVQMDPSFKQYAHNDGIDPIQISGIDIPDVINTFIQSGSVNAQENQVAGFDSTIIVAANQQIKSSVETYVKNNLENPKMFDVVGGRNTIIQTFPNLPSSLSNPIVVIGKRYSNIPPALQNRIEISLGVDIFGEPLNKSVYAWPEMNNHKVTLSYNPATLADEEALLSFIPDGDLQDISQLPENISSYLINVIPELKVDGVVRYVGSALRLGEEIDLSYNIIRAGQSVENFRSPVIAGSYQALTTIGGSISSTQLQRVENRLTETENILASNDPLQLSQLKREDGLGDMFYAGALSYFSQMIILNHVGSVIEGSHTSLLPSMGTYGYVPKVNYFFGFPSSISPGGIEVDLDVISSASANTDNDAVKLKNFMLLTGLAASGLENEGPEQMFTTTTEPADGVSAVKLLSLASQAGQSIYHITASNKDLILSKLNLDVDVISEITASLNYGKEVYTHTDNLTVNGWTGAGYVIFDPVVGDGAYKISGGLNGGLIKTIAEGLDKVINWLSTIEKLFNKTGPASIIKKAISKVKRIVKNVKAVADIALACNPGFALLGIVLYLIQAWIMIKLALALMGAVTVISAGCGPAAGVCAFALNALFVWHALDAFSASLEATADYIVDGCKGM